MSSITFYSNINEDYHLNNKIQRKIISESNFTYRNLIPILNKYVGRRKNVLDIGCGAGTLDFYLASKGIDIIAVDASINALRTARISSSILNMDKKVKFRVVNFPYVVPKGKFDVVILTEVLEHLEDDCLALKKIYGLLNNSGIVILSSPSKNAPLYKIGLLKKFDARVGHLRRYNVDELKFLLEKVGFKIILVKKVEGLIRNFLFTNGYASKLIRFIKFQFSDFVAFVDELTIPFFGESQLIIVVRKPAK